MFQSTNIRTLAAIVVTFALFGCGSGRDGERAVVHGTVRVDGAALADAQVRFVPKDNPDLGTAQAKTDVDGNFTIQPDAHNNNLLRPGEFIVLVSKIVQTDPEGGMGTPTVNLVPALYGLLAETPLRAELKNGDNRLAPFELVSEKK